MYDLREVERVTSGRLTAPEQVLAKGGKEGLLAVSCLVWEFGVGLVIVSLLLLLYKWPPMLCLTQYRFIILLSWRTEISSPSHWAEVNVSAGLGATGGFLALSSIYSLLHFLLLTSSCPVKASTGSPFNFSL
jgi:hypothetical protein